MKHKIHGKVAPDGTVTLIDRTGIFAEHIHAYYLDGKLYIEFAERQPEYTAADIVYPDSFLKITEGEGNIIQVSPGDITKNGISIIDSKQDLLVSGTNIKTINNQSILGEGNLTIGGGGGGGHEEATDAQMDYNNPSDEYLAVKPSQIRAMILAALQEFAEDTLYPEFLRVPETPTYGKTDSASTEPPAFLNVPDTAYYGE